MPATILQWPKDFRTVRSLPFCYLCGRTFAEGEETDRDHVPPKSAFNSRDRETPLILKTHKSCNAQHSVDDKKVGQLIGLRRGEKPNSNRDLALKFVTYANINVVALENLDVDAAVWRWVAGFHAALYRQSMVGARGSIQTPLPRADKNGARIAVRPILQQSLEVVQNIKRNRAHGSLDKIISNGGKLRYECVWCQFDGGDGWFCMFAVDIYDWKNLGSRSGSNPDRGCVGLYTLPDRSVPDIAARDHARTIIVPNFDIYDPFAP